MLGAGWQRLVDELEDELRSLDPEARLSKAEIDSSGLLRLRASLSPENATAGKALLRRYESRATTTCELCGEPGRVNAGPVVVVRCAECSGGRDREPNSTVA
jgi:hypothetical protein